MIDFEQRQVLSSARRFLAPFRENLKEIDPSAFAAVSEFLLARREGMEELLHELCGWSDRELDAFLGAAWRSESDEAREIAALVLQRRGSFGLVYRIEEILGQSGGARWMVDVLGDVQDDESTRLLIQLLDHRDFSIRQRAADGIASHRSTLEPRAFIRHLARPLVKALAHPEPHAVVRALHRIADPALLPDFGRDAARRAERVLINCVRHESRSSVRGDAVAALGEIGSRAAVRCLVDMLSRKDESFHRDVVIALRKIRPENALVALLGLLQSPDPIIREEAAHALGSIGDASAVKRLRLLLEDEDTDVRQEAVLALGKLGGREVLVALEKALDDPDPMVRAAAVSALAQSLGGRAQGDLIHALYDVSPLVRNEAAYHLGNLGNQEARQHLEAKLGDGERDPFGEPVARQVRRSLRRMDVMAERRRRAAR